MARINVWDEQYKRPEAAPVSRALTALGCPDLPLTLRKLGPLEAAAAADQARELITLHLTGDGDHPPLPLLFPGGKKATLSETMLSNVATLQQMQVPDEGEEPYQPLEWLGIADRYPELWAEIIKLSNEVQNPKKTESGNAPPPATGT